jgi:hypothetical protein
MSTDLQGIEVPKRGRVDDSINVYGEGILALNL